MLVKRLELKNFRNYEQESISFSPNVNVLVGKNAQGKTNMLEALYFCSVGKSPRTNKEKDLVRFEEDSSRIYLELEKKYGNKTIEVLFNKGMKKVVKINGVSILKIADMLGTLNCVYFSPQELKLVKDAPEDRRKFMDIDISQLSKTYFYLILRYQKILEQRNALLKSYKDIETVKATLPVWDGQLSEIGAKIVITRTKFVQKLNAQANEILEKLTNQKEHLSLEYTGVGGEDVEAIRQNLYNSLSSSVEKDFKLGYTTVGPHRDDIKIVVNDLDIRTYGSQGQHRTVALAMKLAELEICYEETGDYPILLLDDVLSELDEERQENLLKLCSKVQTIITTATIPESKFKDYKLIEINNGRVISNE